jgi:hypothetical protein
MVKNPIKTGQWSARKKWVCLKMSCSPKPNGFADHYPYEMAIIGNIPYFQTNPYDLTGQHPGHAPSLRASSMMTLQKRRTGPTERRCSGMMTMTRRAAK